MEAQNHSFSFGAHGTHRAWTEGDDVVHIAWHGDVSAKDVADGTRAFELVPNGAKGFFLVMHVADQGNFAAEARRAIGSDRRASWVRGVVIVGASFHIRVLFGMLSRAVTMLQSRKAAVVFLESEAAVPEEIQRMQREWRNKK